MSLIVLALLTPAIATEAPCPSVWPPDGAIDVPIDTLIKDMCQPFSVLDVERVEDGATLDSRLGDPLEPDTDYLILMSNSGAEHVFTTGTELAQPVTDAPLTKSVQTQTFGGGLTAPSLSVLVRHTAPLPHAGMICAYEAETLTRLACRSADGNLALAFETPIGSFPPAELCVELAWHNASGVQGPSSAPMCAAIVPPAAPIEEGCNSAPGPGSWLWLGLLVLVRRRSRH